jgi:hypothetical protein
MTDTPKPDAPTPLTCVLCNQKAITTAAHIPVCQKHWDDYANEARHYPTQRPVFQAMQAAWDELAFLRRAAENMALTLEALFGNDAVTSLSRYRDRYPRQ